MEQLITYITTFESFASLLVGSLEDFGFLAIVFAVFLLGEYAIVITIMLTKDGNFTLTEVMIAASLGTLLADCFWFSVGKYFPSQAIPRILRTKLLTPASSALTSMIRDRNHLVLFLLRFFIGARLIVILHLAKKLSWREFLLGNTVGTFFYLIILAIVGLQLAELTSSLTPAYKTISAILSGVLLLFLTSKILEQILITKEHT